MNKLSNSRKFRIETLEDRILLAVVAGVPEPTACPAPAQAAIWVVNTLDDPADWDSTDDILSLREAIASAVDGDTIVFDDELSDGTITLNGTQLEITSGITINASSIGGVTVDANSQSRVFCVRGGSVTMPVEMDNLIITGGNAGGGTAVDYGGGIDNDGTLILVNCSIVGNSAGYGGGVRNRSILNMVSCSVSGNRATAFNGGGIYNPLGNATIINSIISGNFSDGSGGGVDNNSGALTLINCTVSGNIARDNSYTNGSGIYNSRGSLTLSNAIVAMNYKSDVIEGVQSSFTCNNSIVGINPGFKVAPVFENNELVNIDELDFSLSSSSWAIDRGNNNWVTTETDIAGNARVCESWKPIPTVDIGAYEYIGKIEKEIEARSTVVTSVEDVVDDTDGWISLREAILYAAPGETITFSSSLAGKTVVLSGMEISIDKDIAIDASAIGGITIDGDGKSRVFNILAGTVSTPVKLIDLTITGGKIERDAGIRNQGTLVMTGCTVSGDTSYQVVLIGYGIYNCGTLDLLFCTISQNTSYGIQNSGGSVTAIDCDIIKNRSAGVYNSEISGSSITLTHCNISENSGDGISNSCILTVNDCIVSNNTKSGIQNADYIRSGKQSFLTVSNSVIAGNFLGGVQNAGGTVTLANSIVTENVIDGSGGGIYNGDSWTDVPSVYHKGTMILENCIVTRNTTTHGYGGGIYNGNATLTMTNCTIAGNVANNGYGNYDDGGGIYNYGTLTSYNSIIAQNKGKTNIYNSGDATAINTLSSSPSEWSRRTNFLSFNNKLPLFTGPENGDFSLALDSQAIDKGDNDYAVTETDLVGDPRIVNGIVDLGAYEFTFGSVGTPSILTGMGNNYVSYGANRHQIIWNEVDNTSTYELEYSENGGETWTTIQTLETKAVITGLTYGCDVIYRVRALGDPFFIDSVWSTEKSFNVCPMDTNNDGDIGGLDRSIMSFSWGTGEGDEKYRFYADINGDGDVTGLDRSILSVNWGLESGDPDLLYPRPLIAADAVFCEFASADPGVELDVF